MSDENQITLADVRRLRVEEGDTLVVFVPDTMSADGFKAVRRMMAEVFPENRAMAMPASMRLEVVSEIKDEIKDAVFDGIKRVSEDRGRFGV